MKNANRQVIIDVLVHGGYISHEEICDHIRLHNEDGEEIASMMQLQLDKLIKEDSVTKKSVPWSYYSVYKIKQQ